MRNQPLKFGCSANKLVAPNAAENLASMIIAVVVHESGRLTRKIVSVKLDPVFALRFGGVEGAGGGRNYFLPGIDIFTQGGDSNTDRDIPLRLRLAVGLFSFCDSLAHAFRNYPGFAKRGLWQQDAELLAAIATSNVGGT